MTLNRGLVTLVVLAVLAVVGCASDAPAPPRRALDTRLEITDFRFEPATLAAVSGQPVTVTNRDGSAHTVTADDKSFDTGDVAGGGTVVFVPSTPGTVPFHCAIHDYMRGSIQVGASHE